VFEGSRGGVSIGGQRGINATYAIDGASYDNPFFGGIRGGERGSGAYTISQEAIQEFQVTNAGYSAEFGRSGGGGVNAVTKSGTNQLRGSAFWYFRDESMTSKDPFDRPPTDFRQHQFGASLGGPLRRDKILFPDAGAPDRLAIHVERRGPTPADVPPDQPGRTCVPQQPAGAAGKHADNLFVSGPTSNSPTTGNQLFNGSGPGG
jgi:hypothetical protein